MKPIHPERLKKQVQGHLKRLIEDTDTPESTPFSSNKLMALNMTQKTPDNKKLLNSYASDYDMELESISDLAQPRINPSEIQKDKNTNKSSTLSEYSEYESAQTHGQKNKSEINSKKSLTNEKHPDSISSGAFSKKNNRGK